MPDHTCHTEGSAVAEQPSSGPWQAGQGQVESHIAENLVNDSISRNFTYLTVGCLARLSIRAGRGNFLA